MTDKPDRRTDLPAMPRRLKSRPTDRRGFPVPYFLIDQDERAAADGFNWDFRVVDMDRPVKAVREDVCWICGQKLNFVRVFVLGCMCAVNLITSEAPCHRECAVYAATACPFLVNPKASRRSLSEDLEVRAKTPGIMLKRNPGVVLLWPARRGEVEAFRSGHGILFHLEQPGGQLQAYCEGRPATADEVLFSIETGLPALREAALAQGRAQARSQTSVLKQLAHEAENSLDIFKNWLPQYPTLAPNLEAAFNNITAEGQRQHA